MAFSVAISVPPSVVRPTDRAPARAKFAREKEGKLSQALLRERRVPNMGPEAVGRGFVNTNQKVALKLLPVSGPERMPHCSFLKNEEFLKNSLPCFMTII